MTKGGIPDRENPEVLEGIIIPTSWDEKGHPTEFSLFTLDEREYKIDSSHGKGEEISAFIKKKIRISYRRDKEKRSANYIRPEDIREISELEE